MERSAAVQHQQDEAIVKQVLHKLSPQEMELLILASVADREGRALTELEWAARQAYRLALLQECVVAGRRPTEGLEAPSALHQILVSAHLGRLSREDLVLVSSGLQAQQEGRPVSTSEAAALQTFQCEWERLIEMAGLTKRNVPQPGEER